VKPQIWETAKYEPTKSEGQVYFRLTEKCKETLKTCHYLKI